MMNIGILQTWLLDFPALLGPAVTGFGAWILLSWHLERHVIPSLTINRNQSSTVRALVIVPFVSGLMFATVGFLLYIDRLWIGMLFLHALGRMIEGGVVVYGIRRLWHIIHRLIAFLDQQSAKEGSSATYFVRRILRRYRYRFFAFTMSIFGAGSIFSISYVFLNNPWFLSIRYAIGVFVGISVGVMLIWYTYKTARALEIVATYGIILCIVGAEIYAYDNTSYPLAAIIPGFDESTLLSISDAIPLINLWDVTTVIVGQIAFLFGLILSILFLLVRPARSQDRSGPPTSTKPP